MSPGSLQTRSRISAATLAGDRRSPVGWIGALLLHAAIVFATLFTFAHKLEIAEESPPVIPVDLVTIGAKTNIAPTVKVQPKAPPKQETPVEPPKPEPSPIQPPQQAQETPPPPPEQAPAEQVAKIPPPPPMPKLKPQPTEKPPKEEKFDINNISALLDKRAPAASSAPNAKLADRTLKGIGAQNAMTMDLQDSLRNQISQCWSPPVGAPHPEELVVGFELFLNADGSVAQPPQLSADSQAAIARDPFTRAAAEAARRAIYTCAPYKLPADRYKDWHDITLNFDPRQMMGQ
jgi:outer membrane biosynthesis protein TonB